jgi:hypothetical protein
MYVKRAGAETYELRLTPLVPDTVFIGRAASRLRCRAFWGWMGVIGGWIERSTLAGQRFCRAVGR